MNVEFKILKNYYLIGEKKETNMDSKTKGIWKEKYFIMQTICYKLIFTKAYFESKSDNSLQNKDI